MLGRKLKDPYQKLRPSLETGDLVLFSGKGDIPAVIKWFSGSKWNHIGMVLNIQEWDTILLWESTILSRLKDVAEKKIKHGVQLVALSERVSTYTGAVAYRKLNVTRTDEMIQSLIKFRHEVKDKPYEQSVMELIKSSIDFGGWNHKNKEDLSSLFCSELIAEAYQRMGILDESKPSNEYTPRDFTLEISGELPLINGAT